MATSEQAELSGSRTIRIGTASHASAPTDGALGTVPDMTLSTMSPGGPTLGFLLQLRAPSSGAAVAGGGGFTVTVWVRDPVLRQWGSFEATTGVDFGELYTTADIDASELYFQIANVGTPGDVDVKISEQ